MKHIKPKDIIVQYLRPNGEWAYFGPLGRGLEFHRERNPNTQLRLARVITTTVTRAINTPATGKE